MKVYLVTYLRYSYCLELQECYVQEVFADRISANPHMIAMAREYANKGYKINLTITGLYIDKVRVVHTETNTKGSIVEIYVTEREVK